MGRLKKQLDELIRQEKHDSFRRYSIYAAIIAIFLVATVAYSTGEKTIIEVPVTHIYSEASESHQSFYIIVQIDALKTKKIRVPRATSVKVGDKVKVLVRTTKLFNLKKYIFQKVPR